MREIRDKQVHIANTVKNLLAKNKNRIRNTKNKNADLFEKKLTAFKGLSTFFDIKDYIQNLNIINHSVSQKIRTQNEKKDHLKDI